jgi:pterin-4a-carbinolamine dehydratase
MPHLEPADVAELRAQIDGSWEVVGDTEKLRRRVKTGDFAESMALAVRSPKAITRTCTCTGDAS